MMPRVDCFFDRFGNRHHNTGRPRIPFRLMKSAGDWCEVDRGPDCLAGNVAALCSAYSHQLGRRFTFRDMKNGVFRITVTTEKVARRPRR